MRLFLDPLLHKVIRNGDTAALRMLWPFGHVLTKRTLMHRWMPKTPVRELILSFEHIDSRGLNAAFARNTDNLGSYEALVLKAIKRDSVEALQFLCEQTPDGALLAVVLQVLQWYINPTLLTTSQCLDFLVSQLPRDDVKRGCCVYLNALFHAAAECHCYTALPLIIQHTMIEVNRLDPDGLQQEWRTHVQEALNLVPRLMDLL